MTDEIKFKKFLLISIILFIVSACASLKDYESGMESEDQMSKKIEDRDINLPEGSTILDAERSGFDLGDLLGGRSSTDLSFNVIAFQTALDKLDFMPLVSVDISSGVIVTDWYSLDGGNQRIKINVRVVDEELSDDSLEVKLFKQIYENGRWVDLGQDDDQANKIQKSILEEARALQIASEL